MMNKFCRCGRSPNNRPLFVAVPAIELPFLLAHLGLEDILQLAPRLLHPRDMLAVWMVRHQLAQHPHIQTAEVLLGTKCLVRVHAQRHQRLTAQLQRTAEGFTRELHHAGLQQLMGLHTATSAGQNLQTRKMLLAQMNNLH